MAGGWGRAGGDVPEEGETFVWGKTQAMARELLAAAADLGLESLVVRTSTQGFIVPDAVWDAVEEKRSAAGGEF